MQAIHNCDCDETEELREISQIIIMYIHHALINALSAHMIHINLNMIFCTHVEHGPTKTIYIKYSSSFFKEEKKRKVSVMQRDLESVVHKNYSTT